MAYVGIRTEWLMGTGYYDVIVLDMFGYLFWGIVIELIPLSVLVAMDCSILRAPPLLPPEHPQILQRVNPRQQEYPHHHPIVGIEGLQVSRRPGGRPGQPSYATRRRRWPD